MGNLYTGLQAIMEAERSSAGNSVDVGEEAIEAPIVVEDGETENQIEPAAEG